MILIKVLYSSPLRPHSSNDEVELSSSSSTIIYGSVVTVELVLQCSSYFGYSVHSSLFNPNQTVCNYVELFT